MDDERFAREMAAYETGRKAMGRRGAMASLRKLGVSVDVAERAVDEVAPEDEEERATELARARLARMGSVDPQAAYRRLVGFLGRRGYMGETARVACRRALDEARGEVG